MSTGHTHRSVAVIVLGLGLQLNGRRVLHDALARHLDELVKRVQLLPNQALLVKVRAVGQATVTLVARGQVIPFRAHQLPDDNPARLLPEVRRYLILLIVVPSSCHEGKGRVGVGQKHTNELQYKTKLPLPSLPATASQDIVTRHEL